MQLWETCSLLCVYIYICVQAWSIVFHSWLSFVLLISACLMWMVPKKRQLCLRCSPVVVVYAVCLVTLQYIYGFDLTDDELPTTAHGYSLSEIGLVKYRYPVGPLAAQVCLKTQQWFSSWYLKRWTNSLLHVAAVSAGLTHYGCKCQIIKLKLCLYCQWNCFLSNMKMEWF